MADVRRKARNQNIVRQRVGFCARQPPGGNLVGQPAQIFDENDAQRDGDGPEFADRQRLDTLVGGNEPAQDFGVEMAVGVGDECPGHFEDARISGKRSSGQFRQLPVVAGSEIVADFADMFLDEMVVVEKPFGGRDNRAPVFQFLALAR